MESSEQSKTRAIASIAVAAVLLLVPASRAAAAERFASPTGSASNPCTVAAPCDIGTAINSASNGDDVTIEPGTYGPVPAVPELDDNGHKLTIHGEVGGSRPVIVSGADVGFKLTGANTSLSDVEVDSTSFQGGDFEVFDGTNVAVDRVISHALGAEATACGVFAGSLTVTNSVCVADGPDSFGFGAINSGSATLRNDTVEAPGGSGSDASVGIGAGASSGSQLTVGVSNVIAHGAGVDLVAETDSNASSSAVITADHSNYVTTLATMGTGTKSITPPGSGTNQMAAPLFVNPGSDDFHERAGSPTIGAGFSSPANGSLDLDGNPREFDGHTDIGAYEFVPQPAPPSAPDCVVPKLKGRSLAKVRALLAAAHCTLGKVKKPKHKARKHLIVKSQSLSPGTVLSNGASVTIRLGPKPHRKRR